MKTPALILLSLLTLTAWGQTRKPATKTTTPASTSAAPAQLAPGELVYTQYCLTCHQASGSGVPKLNPPLKGTSWVLGDKTRLIGVILKGLENVDIDDESYDNAMPAHDFLTDAQIADVLTYVRSHFGNKADAVVADEVKTVRAGAGK